MYDMDTKQNFIIHIFHYKFNNFDSIKCLINLININFFFSYFVPVIESCFIPFLRINSRYEVSFIELYDDE